MDFQPCTYEQSKKLKALGFNWYTPDSYMNKEYVKSLGWVNTWLMTDPKLKIPSEMQKTAMVSAPTTALAVRWFRESKIAILEINTVGGDWNHWTFDVLFADYIDSPIEQNDYDTYEEAEIAGIDFILKQKLNKL